MYYHVNPFCISLRSKRFLASSSRKSPGPDKISARVLKDCLPVILGPLTDIINCSILTSTFPDNWKEAEEIPILKDGDHEKAANNRPLSLLAVASKVLERIVLNQFSAYLTKNDRLTSHQSGNKKAHSTETLNILLTDKILEAMDKKQITALVLLGFPGAMPNCTLSDGASVIMIIFFKTMYGETVIRYSFCDVGNNQGIS